MKAIILALTICASLGSDLFSGGKVLTIQIDTSESDTEFLKIQPKTDVEARVIESGVIYSNVAVHLKGSSRHHGSWPPGTWRPSFTLSFSKWERFQTFHAQRKIHLNNSVSDPTLLAEQLCGELFRIVNVPAARVAHCRVIWNGRDLGFYIIKESFEKQMLERYFKDARGAVHELPEQGKRNFLAETGQSFRYIDTNRFVSMMAMETLTGHEDGYSYGKNNYRIYDNPEDGLLVFMVHGMDQMFISSGKLSGQMRMNNADFNGEIAKAFYASPEGRTAYEQRLREIFAKHFQLETLTNRVRELAVPVRAEIERTEGKDAANRHDGEVDKLVQRIANRWHYVDRELNPK